MKVRPHSEAVRNDLIVPKNSVRRNGTRYTVTAEVKEWLAVMIKNHWYLYEDRQIGGLKIAFHDHNDALKYKLAWH